MTEQGAYAGIMTGGLISAVVVIGTLAKFWTFEQPALLSVPAAFLAIYLVSRATWSRQSNETMAELEKAFHQLHNPRYDNKAV